MTHLDVEVTYRFIGTDAKIAAFSAWLLNQPIQPDDDSVVKLATDHGLMLQQHAIGLGGARSDPFPGDPNEDTVG